MIESYIYGLCVLVVHMYKLYVFFSFLLCPHISNPCDATPFFTLLKGKSVLSPFLSMAQNVWSLLEPSGAQTFRCPTGHIIPHHLSVNGVIIHRSPKRFKSLFFFPFLFFSYIRRSDVISHRDMWCYKWALDASSLSSSYSMLVYNTTGCPVNRPAYEKKI